MITWLMVVSTLFAAPSQSSVDAECATAIAAVFDHLVHEARSNGDEAYGLKDIRKDYAEFRCTASNVKAGRIFVHYAKPKLLRIHAVFIVEPSLVVRAARSMPCEENPSACQ